MEIVEIGNAKIELDGKSLDARVLGFNNFSIPHGKVLDFIDSTHDPNEAAHGIYAELPVAPGFQIETLVHHLIGRHLEVSGMKGYFPDSYKFVFRNAVPVNSRISGEVYMIEQKEGELLFVPSIYVVNHANNRIDESICGEVSDRKNSRFYYTSTPRTNTTNTEEVANVRLDDSKYISAVDIALFKEAMGLDISEKVPAPFLTALSSKAIGEKIKRDSLFNDRIPIYISREVVFYKTNKPIALYDILNFATFVKEKEKAAKTRVIAYTSDGERVYESTSNLILLKRDIIQ